MTAQIIPFPIIKQPPPTFCEWMRQRLGGKKWYVVRVRRYGGKFQFSPERDVLILQREYRALEAQYSRETGCAPW